jgi:mevalonate kinase
MPAITATAPGKIILFGEHAVVYGRPAIAIPVTQVYARALLQADPRGPGGCMRVQAPDIKLDAWLADIPQEDPLAAAIRGTLKYLGVDRLPACTLRVTSTIPLAAGLGSGAAVSIAVIRAVSAFLGHPLGDEQVCDLAYEVEKIYHGTPSGIDNSVIAYAQPIFFVRGQPIERFAIRRPFTLVIGDTGIPSPTAVAVGDLRRAWQANPAPYEALFDAVGRITAAARRVMQSNGSPHRLGPLMDENQAVLIELGVSSPELERLLHAAHAAGALGAKLSGGGRGGNMIALATQNTAAQVASALFDAGAVRTIITQAGDG